MHISAIFNVGPNIFCTVNKKSFLWLHSNYWKIFQSEAYLNRYKRNLVRPNAYYRRFQVRNLFGIGQIVRRKNMEVDSIDKVAGIRDILSSPHLLLDDTFIALLATTYRVSQHTADIHRGLNSIRYACKLGDCNCYLVYCWRSWGVSQGNAYIPF
jgi:hypothetical protein